QRIAEHLDPDGRAMVPLWIPGPTRKQEIGRTREAVRADGSTARYTIHAEEYDESRRTRRTRTLYELHKGQHVERVRRDWIIHWHTPDGFADLARTAALEVTRHDPLENGEFTVYLRRASTSRWTIPIGRRNVDVVAAGRGREASRGTTVAIGYTLRDTSVVKGQQRAGSSRRQARSQRNRIEPSVPNAIIMAARIPVGSNKLGHGCPSHSPCMRSAKWRTGEKFMMAWTPSGIVVSGMNAPEESMSRSMRTLPMPVAAPDEG